MSTFNRYFIHFFCISFFVFFILNIILYFEKNALNTPIFLLISFFSVLIFSIPMSIYFSRCAKNKTINLKINNEDDLEAKLEEKIQKKFKREVLVLNHNVKEYRMKNKYHAWLTNSIKISNEKDCVVLSIPTIYAEEIENEFFRFIMR